MSYVIKVEGNANAAITSTLIGFECALGLYDDDGKKVQATFDLSVDGDYIPLIGITQYGRITGLYGFENDLEIGVTITASVIGLEDESTSVYVLVEHIFSAEAGDELTDDSDDQPLG